MSQRSISAYDLSQRVAAYDADMEIMHPNRTKMVQVALELLLFEGDARLRALDLGIGTGYFTERFLEAFPYSDVHGIDGAATMVDVANVRLRARTESVTLQVGDFRALGRLAAGITDLDVVYSSYALHHLTRGEKASFVREAASLLRPGGWFVNADIIVADTPEAEERLQDLRIRGIVQRSGGADPRFPDAGATQRFLDELEAKEGDQPLRLGEDVQLLRDAGLRRGGVLAGIPGDGHGWLAVACSLATRSKGDR